MCLKKGDRLGVDTESVRGAVGGGGAWARVNKDDSLTHFQLLCTPG